MTISKDNVDCTTISAVIWPDDLHQKRLHPATREAQRPSTMTSRVAKAMKYMNTLILTGYNTNEIDIRFIESHTHHSSQSSLIMPAAFSAIPYNEELKCADS